MRKLTCNRIEVAVKAGFPPGLLFFAADPLARHREGLA